MIASCTERKAEPSPLRRWRKALGISVRAAALHVSSGWLDRDTVAEYELVEAGLRPIARLPFVPADVRSAHEAWEGGRR